MLMLKVAMVEVCRWNRRLVGRNMCERLVGLLLGITPRCHASERYFLFLYYKSLRARVAYQKRYQPFQLCATFCDDLFSLPVLYIV